MAELDHWVEWKERCAIDLCGDETRASLQAFASQRWARFLDMILDYFSPELGELNPSEVWHRFETWCWTTSTVAGKSYKDWIFRRLETHTGTPLDIIQSGATLVLRGAVRDFIRHEGRTRFPGARKPEVSLEDPVPGSEGKLTYGDLLPGELDAASEAGIREYQRLANEEAIELVPTLKQRERLVLAASRFGLAMSDPRLQRIAGKKKSVLSAALKGVAEKIERHIGRKYADDQEGDRRVLAIAVLSELRRLSCDPKISSETWLDDLFKLGSLEN
jgi:hypothetical protein